VITAETITDEQIRELQTWLFERHAFDELELSGLVAVHDALGRSHRRKKARARCAEILNNRTSTASTGKTASP
jgi:hypothetical protein